MSVLGLDIGGANLKAAHSTGIAKSLAFPLWRSPEKIAEQLRFLCQSMPAFDRLAITMTGELCDCYASKADGVRAILAAVTQVADAKPVQVWSTAGSFVDMLEAAKHPLAVAASNWLALATLTGHMFRAEHVLLLDIGSTTTDLVFIDKGQPQPRGRTDRQRLDAGELVYSGLRRTPVCAVLGPEVAAEFFATMLDVYVVLGLVPESFEDHDTADSRPRTISHAHARLARLRCADVDEFPLHEAQQLAQKAHQRQLEVIGLALQQVLHERAKPSQIVLSGTGEIVGRQVCVASPHLVGIPIQSLAEKLGSSLSDSACAYAVAKLAEM